MRLWSIHPVHLDRQGLLAVWREGLLARAVLRGRTRGYRNHPQLERFHAHRHSLDAIDGFLLQIHREAVSRGYAFDRRKIGRTRNPARIPVTRGQLQFERRHLLSKLKRRDPERARALRAGPLRVHPSFRKVSGGVAPWERGATRNRRPRS